MDGQRTDDEETEGRTDGQRTTTATTGWEQRDERTRDARRRRDDGTDERTENNGDDWTEPARWTDRRRTTTMGRTMGWTEGRTEDDKGNGTDTIGWILFDVFVMFG